MSINIPAGKAASETEEAAEEFGCPMMVFLGGSKNPFEAGLFEIIPLLVFIGLKNKTLYITHHFLLVYIYTMSIKILNYTLCVQVQLQYEVNFRADLKKKYLYNKAMNPSASLPRQEKTSSSALRSYTYFGTESILLSNHNIIFHIV